MNITHPLSTRVCVCTGIQTQNGTFYKSAVSLQLEDPASAEHLAGS